MNKGFIILMFVICFFIIGLLGARIDIMEDINQQQLEFFEKQNEFNSYQREFNQEVINKFNTL